MSEGLRRDAPDAWSLAFTFVACVLVGTGIGYLLDRFLHTLPWLMVAGVFGGAGLGFVYVVYILFTTGSGGRGRKKGTGGNDGSDARSS